MSRADTAGQNELLDSMLGDFLDESDQLLNRLNENLMGLDEWVRAANDPAGERCDASLLNELFRAAHSLKGLSAMLGLSDINQLTHKLENVFDAARGGQLPLGAGAVDLMFRSVDRLSAMVDVLRAPDNPPVRHDDVIDAIQHLLQAAGADRAQASQADAERALRDVGAEVAAAEALLTQAAGTAPPPPSPQAPATPADAPADAFDDLRDDPDIPGKYLALFVDEAERALEKLTESLLSIESGGGLDELRKAMGIAHQIKGSAGCVGLNRAARLAHLMEDLVQEAPETGGSLSSSAVNAMLQCAEGLRQYVDGLRKGQPESVPLDTFYRQLTSLGAGDGARPDHEEPRGTVPLCRPGGAPEPCATAPRGPLPVDSVFPEEFRQQVAEAALPGIPILLGDVRFQAGLPLVGLKARLIYDKLSNLGEVCGFEPPPEQLDDLEALEQVRFAVMTERPREQVRAHLAVTGVRTLEIARLSEDEASSRRMRPAARGAAPAPREAASSRPAAAKPAPTVSSAGGAAARAAGEAPPHPSEKDRPVDTVRVDTERLDQLMNLAGQLMINKTRFDAIGHSLKTHLSGGHGVRRLDAVLGSLDRLAAARDAGAGRRQLPADLDGLWGQVGRVRDDLGTLRGELESLARARSAIGDLFEAVHQLDRVSNEIRQSVMATRMVPIGPLFHRFKRVIRDISRTSGKDIRLVVRGEKTELDKRLIDELSDPLTHAIRNAADHGIESPQARSAAGKPPEGTVTLDAFHRGNSIVIQVSDDGQGLDTERILAKCLEKGLVAPPDAAKMTPRQIWQMIWAPGFSTADKVTEISGRGMGMDIVRSKIADINGAAELDSVPGQGTTLSIKLPLTLAILPSLMVEIGGDSFAVPMESVQEIIRVPAGDLVSIQGQAAVCLRGRTIARKRLEELFTWRRPGLKREAARDGPETLVIVGEAGREIAMAVDGVVGEQNIVIKSIAENYKNVPGVAGATVLGDGRVSLILDVPALVAALCKNADASPTA